MEGYKQMSIQQLICLNNYNFRGASNVNFDAVIA